MNKMNKVKGFIRNIDITYNHMNVEEFGNVTSTPIQVGPPEVRVELSLTEGDIYALVEHMKNNQAIEIEMPEKEVRVAKGENLEKPRIWRLIEVGEC